MSNFTRSSLQSIFSHEWTRNIKILKYRIHSCQFQRSFEMGSLIFSIKINETQFNFHVITTWIFLFDEIKREDLFFTHNYVSSLFHFPYLRLIESRDEELSTGIQKSSLGNNPLPFPRRLNSQGRFWKHGDKTRRWEKAWLKWLVEFPSVSPSPRRVATCTLLNAINDLNVWRPVSRLTLL